MNTRLIIARIHRIRGSLATGAHRVGRVLNASLVVIWLCAGISRGADGSAKLPVPDSAAQKTSQQLIDEIYGKQVRAAMTREGRSALAKKLLDTSHEEKDSTARYVLLNMSKNLAADGGDADAALAAVAELDRTYAIDTIAVKAETLRAAAKNGKLLTDGGGDMELRFGYHPPAEYDYVVDYFREDGHLGTALLFTRLDALCVLSLPSDAHATFAMGPPEGQPGNRFEATIPHLEGGSRIKIQVRNDGLTVFVNNLKIIDHRMPDWKAPPLPSWMLSGGPTAVGIIGFYGRITIKSAEIVEVSGPGAMLH